MVVDSDEEVEEVQSIDAKAYKKGLSAYRPSPPPANSNGETFNTHVLFYFALVRVRVTHTEISGYNRYSILDVCPWTSIYALPSSNSPSTILINVSLRTNSCLFTS